MRVFRQTGRPVTNFSEYQIEINEAFDDIEKAIGKFGLNNNEKEFQELLALSDQKLKMKFPIEDTWAYPKSVKDIKKLCDEFGSLAFCMEDGRLTCYILDTHE